jgi:hypothetical protein
MARKVSRIADNIWPLTIYPSGKAEVVFQWMLTRPPFDEFDCRDEFRRRLNAVPGVGLPAVKVGMRPGFDLSVLSEAGRREQVVEQLAWFLRQVRAHDRDD